MRTARNTRQELPTGSIDELLSLYPKRTAPSITLGPPQAVTTKFPDQAVQRSRDFIAHSGIAEYITDRRAAQKAKPGRPAKISHLALLVAMHLTVADDKPLLLTAIRQTLLERLTPPSRRLLDITYPTRPADRAGQAQWEKAADAAVRRALHRLLDSVDPSTMPKNRRRTWEQVHRLKKDLSIEEQQERATALDWVCNQLLETAFQQLPQRVRDRLQQKGHAYAIDATVVEMFARGRGIDNPLASTDPDGGWYVREGDHRDPHDVAEGREPQTTDLKKKRTANKYIWGREAHLLTLGDASHADRLYMPRLPFAFSTGVPGVDPAGAARRIFANVLHRGHQPGPVAGDILYTNQNPHKYQIPARKAGFGLVLGYGVDQVGVQGAHESGMLLVDGGYHAPCMPDHLINAITDLRNVHMIEDKQERDAKRAEITARIKARLEYRMRSKQNGNRGKRNRGGAEDASHERGDLKERLSCPAAGPSPTAVCALKPKSQAERPIRQPDGTRVDLRRIIDHTKVLTDGQAPKVCQQESVTVGIEDGAKFRQSLPFGSPEQIDLYNRLRQATEGVHGSAKDEATTALASPGRRRARGWAALQLFSAFLLAETATRRIITFLKNAKTDHEGHLYVDRRKRTGDHAPTGAPPGAPLPGAPPVIDLPDAA